MTIGFLKEEGRREFDELWYEFIHGLGETGMNTETMPDFIKSFQERLIDKAFVAGRESEVADGLRYMNAEARDGLPHEELVKSWIRYFTNRAMDFEEARANK